MSVGAVNKQTGERIPTAGLPAVDSVLSGVSTNPVQNRVVKAAFDGKQDTLTFDDTPTDGSNNPVKSNGVYDALATKTNTDMVAADFNAGTSYTAGNYCIYEGKFYKFKNNHSGAWSAADVDEIKIAGELSSLKSGLTNKTELKTEIMILNIGSDGLFTIPAASFSDNVQHRVICIQPTQWWHKSIILGGPDGNGCQGSIDVSEATSLQCYVTYIV